MDVVEQRREQARACRFFALFVLVSQVIWFVPAFLEDSCACPVHDDVSGACRCTPRGECDWDCPALTPSGAPS